MLCGEAKIDVKFVTAEKKMTALNTFRRCPFIERVSVFRFIRGLSVAVHSAGNASHPTRILVCTDVTVTNENAEI